jgi:hypothetical protein
MSNGDARPNLKRTLLVTAAIVLVAIIGIGGAVGLSTLAFNSSQHSQQVAAQQAANKAEVVSVKAAIPLCQALQQMDNASVGATNASNSPSSYGHRLAIAIHKLFVNTKCNLLLADVAQNQPYMKIYRELNK